MLLPLNNESVECPFLVDRDLSSVKIIYLEDLQVIAAKLSKNYLSKKHSAEDLLQQLELKCTLVLILIKFKYEK